MPDLLLLLLYNVKAFLIGYGAASLCRQLLAIRRSRKDRP